MTNTQPIDGSEDILDSRDVMARREELRELRPEGLPDKPSDADYPEDGSWSEDEERELQELAGAEDQGSGYGDWEHGETLIRDSYFEEYAQDLAEDLGMIKREVSWPYT